MEKLLRPALSVPSEREIRGLDPLFVANRQTWLPEFESNLRGADATSCFQMPWRRNNRTTYVTSALDNQARRASRRAVRAAGRPPLRHFPHVEEPRRRQTGAFRSTALISVRQRHAACGFARSSALSANEIRKQPRVAFSLPAIGSGSKVIDDWSLPTTNTCRHCRRRPRRGDSNPECR